MHHPSDTMYAIEDFCVRHKTRLAATFVGLVVFVWLTGTTAGITAMACGKERMEPEKRVIYCSISLTAGFAFDIIPLEYRRSSLVQLARGIAYLQSDRFEKASADFREAIAVLVKYSKNENHRDAHMRIITSHSDPRVEPFWRTTFDALIAEAESANRTRAAN